MDFVGQVKELAIKIPGKLAYIQTEAATRSALIDPFIRALGYDVSDTQEVTPEFGAHLNIPGIAKDKRVDYAILREGKPIILIEAKHHKDKLIQGYDQLFAYAITTCCRIGILTNGLVWQFYADLAHPGTGKLDPTPFLELDLQDLKEPLLEELRPLTKSDLNIDGMLKAAEELNGVGGILQILNQEFDNPGDDFVKFFYQRLADGKPFVGNSKALFTGYAKRAFGQFIRARVNRMLDESLGNDIQAPPIDLPIPPAPEVGVSSIVTTEEEMEGFYIVKSILRDVVSSERVTHKDVVSYFGIFLDGNSHKPICRLYFNNLSNKRLGILIRGEDDKQESKHPIDRLDHIYQYAGQLKSAAQQYVAQPVEGATTATAL
ncbi:MAG: type I restriction enzyme HsdR N-terminal domain-containing protein [Cyanobacteria bacterium CAN_BIN43]|nr:type I restriction enzyme HsdR N-terminal domain-containing protein [Cyanobacteria bacterium CAN_BIN43]